MARTGEAALHSGWYISGAGHVALIFFILFGGLLAWAVVSVIVINRQTERPEPPESYPMANEIKAIVGTIVVYAVISGVHIWLGYNPFGA